jgi:hypothetical protein
VRGARRLLTVLARVALRAVAHALRRACRPAGVWQGYAVAEDQGAPPSNAPPLRECAHVRGSVALTSLRRPPGRSQKEHCLCHLATGDMLREAVAAKTPLGLQARARARPIGSAVMLVQCDRAWARRASLPVAHTSQGLRTSGLPRAGFCAVCACAPRARLRVFLARAPYARFAPFYSPR